MKKILFLISLAVLFSFAFVSAIDISTCEELQNMSNDLAGNYVLVNDIDCTGVSFISIGNDTNRFTGSLDGNGFKIINLNIIGGDYSGLFGYSTGIINNVELQNVSVSGGYYTGGLVGWNAGLVNNSYSQGHISNSERGGILVGINGGSVINSHSSGDINCGFICGGLIGRSSGSSLINNSYSNATINTGVDIGGLIGQNGGASFIDNSYATGNVNGGNYAGGFVGINWGNIRNSWASGNVSGDTVAGFVAEDWGASTFIINCSASGNVNGGNYAGGFVSYMKSGAQILKSKAIGNVVGGNYIGGFAASTGYSSGTGVLTNDYATGNVTGIDYVGGLVGFFQGGTITNSYSIGNVTGDTNVGGLVGNNNLGTVTNSFWDMNTSGQTTSDVGTGKTTSEMKNITTFSNAGWDITYTQDNLNNGYPFLSNIWLIYEQVYNITTCKTSGWIENGVYILQNDLPSVEGDCFIIDTDNVTLDLGGYTITGDGTGYGVDLDSYNNVNILNGSITNFDINLLIGVSENDTFSNLTITSGSSKGISMENSNYNNFTNIISSGNGDGINGDGIYLTSSTNNIFENITSNSNDLNGIYLTSSSNYNNFTNVSALSNSAKDLYAEYSQEASFMYYNFGEYDITFQRVYFGNDNGGIYFTETNGGGTDLMNDLVISNNYAFAGIEGFNYISNITLNNVPVFPNPKILKDGEECLDCIAFTELSGTVLFQVSGWSNYTIFGELNCGILDPSNYTTVGGTIIAVDGSPFLNSYVNVSFDYTYKKNSQAGQSILDTTEALTGTTGWFGIIIVLTAMVVLIFLTVLIIRAVKGTQFTA